MSATVRESQALLPHTVYAVALTYRQKLTAEVISLCSVADEPGRDTLSADDIRSRAVALAESDWPPQYGRPEQWMLRSFAYRAVVLSNPGDERPAEGVG